ncbi:MAG: gamma-glutamyltransferase [Nitratireductor sp.]|nr:gamma-glutamyltransferase [Nitratireductor sp.]
MNFAVALKTACVLLTAWAIASGHPAAAQEASERIAPEAGHGLRADVAPPATAREFMVVSANPEASRAGLAILEKGGNAIDAMIAVQVVLGLVEPQSSGLGGGAFVVYWDQKTQKLTTLDGRETAPAEATPDLFLDAGGKPLRFFDAVIGGRSVGTPATVALLETAHRNYGKLDWASLFEPAIALAERGFEVSPRLNASIGQSAESLFGYEATRDYFLSEEAVPLPAGTVLKNPAYAATLRDIAKGGAEAFYGGEIAQAIVDTVRGAQDNPGRLSMRDMADYKIVERAPVCVTYRVYEVCGMGPPSSGALTVGQILKLVEPYDLAALGPDNAQSWRMIGDASRLAFADRGLYMADSDFVDMPKGLLNADYLRERAKLLEGAGALPQDAVKPGTPPADHALLLAPGMTPELPSTSHLSIVDGEGNVVSMTTTIENSFGSRLMVRGFLLNNELTDFSFLPERDGVPVANRVEPGKRPRSSMSPSIVFKDGKPVLAIGSPGGSQIIGYVAQAIIAHLDWGMDVAQAVAMPHLLNRFGPFEVEADTRAEAFAPALEALGYDVAVKDMNSGLHAIAISTDGLSGGADPRREGLAVGR